MLTLAKGTDAVIFLANIRQMEIGRKRARKHRSLVNLKRRNDAHRILKR